MSESQFQHFATLTTFSTPLEQNASKSLTILMSVTLTHPASLLEMTIITVSPARMIPLPGTSLPETATFAIE